MKREEFRRWLSSRGLSEKSVSNYVSECQWVNNYVGDLDEAFETDRCESMLRGISFGGKAGDLAAIIDGDPASNFATDRSAQVRRVPALQAPTLHWWVNIFDQVKPGSAIERG